MPKHVTEGEALTSVPGPCDSARDRLLLSTVPRGTLPTASARYRPQQANDAHATVPSSEVACFTRC
jgi:hypothetical protein